MDNLDRLRETNVERVKLWHPGYPGAEAWTLADWSNAMVGEAGEAANIVKKIRRLDLHLTRRPTETDRAKLLGLLGEEVADVIIYADLLMAREEMSLWPNIVAKFNKTSDEYGFSQRLEM